MHLNSIQANEIKVQQHYGFLTDPLNPIFAKPEHMPCDFVFPALWLHVCKSLALSLASPQGTRQRTGPVLSTPAHKSIRPHREYWVEAPADPLSFSQIHNSLHNTSVHN